MRDAISGLPFVPSTCKDDEDGVVAAMHVTVGRNAVLKGRIIKKEITPEVSARTCR